jgi:hypothetical protein
LENGLGFGKCQMETADRRRHLSRPNVGYLILLGVFGKLWAGMARSRLLALEVGYDETAGL